MEKYTKNNMPLTSEVRDVVIGKALTARMLNGQAPDEICVSLEEIAAFIDDMLPAADRNRVMGHLSRCRSCHKVFLMTSSLLENEEPEELLNVNSGQQKMWYVFTGVAAVAAVAVLAINLSVHTPPDKQQLAQQSVPISQPLVAVTPAQETSQNITPSPKPVLANGQQAQKSRNREELQLISPDEAAAPVAKQFGFSGRTTPDGPEITIESPGEVKQKEGITTLKIKFEPHKPNRINMNSLKLEYLKQDPIDLTGRIKPYANQNGVQADRVKLPAGRHKFRISIADYNGRLSEKDFTILVSFVD